MCSVYLRSGGHGSGLNTVVWESLMCVVAWWRVQSEKGLDSSIGLRKRKGHEFKTEQNKKQKQMEVV